MAGAIQAASRFDVLSRINVFIGVLQIGIIVVLLKLGFSLKEIIISSLFVQLLAIYLYWIAAVRLLPYLSKAILNPASIVQLFRFGGFVMMSSIVGPVLENTEKIFLASLRSIQSLTYYSIPYLIVDKLSLVRSSFSSVLFPTFSYFQNSKAERVNEEIHYRSTLYIFFGYLFFTLFLVFFSRPFLSLWIGEDFAKRSSGILSILSVAGLVNAIAAPSAVALQGMDRPHLPAIFHLIEAVIYVPAAYLLIYKWGGIGAAAAWSLRVLLDTALLHKASCDLFGLHLFAWYGKLIYRGLPPLRLCGLSFWCLKSINLRLLSPANIGALASIFILYVFLVWKWGFDLSARNKALEFIKGALRG